MRYRFVINTAAGRVRLDAALDLIAREFTGLSHEVFIDPSAACLEGICGGVDDGQGVTIVAVGGDGTVSRVVNAAPLREAVLGILPLGTANDLASALEIPDEPIAACRIIRAGRSRRIDLIGVNAKRFVTCGGIGFAAEAAARANRWRHSKRPLLGRFRRLLYPAAAICELSARQRPAMLAIRCGGRRLEAETMTLVVSNQARFGGRFETSPEASNTDGLFDLCEIRAPGSRARMFGMILRALTGRLGRMREVVRMRGTEATLITRRDVRFFGDGEVLDIGSRFDLRLHPLALRVLIPEGAEP